MFSSLYVSVGILITCGKHLHDYIISLRGQVWAQKTSLTPPLLIEVPVPRQESEQSCICVLGVLILPLYTIFLLDFGTVPTVCYF
jgi:hypothetical protein